MTEPNENIAPGRGTATRTSESDEGKASGRGIMSLDAVRRLAWTAIVLFIMAIVFAFNHGPILAWLAANHTPLLVGILQAPLWLVAFLLIVLGLQCWLDIVEDDKTPSPSSCTRSASCCASDGGRPVSHCLSASGPTSTCTA